MMADYYEEYLENDAGNSFQSEFGYSCDVSFDDEPAKSTGSTRDKNGPEKRKRNYSKNSLSVAEKHMLAAEVRNHSLIWDLSHPQHCDNNAVNESWKSISTKLGKPPSECKAAWTSLRDAKRYRAQVKRKKKSGDDGGVSLENPVFGDENACDWEFSKSLTFLPDISKKRRTCTIGTTEEISGASNENSNLLSGDSNYSYTKNRNVSPRCPEKSNTTERLVDSIDKLVNSCSKPETSLMFESICRNWDRMLQKVSEEDFEDTVQEITTLLYNKIKKIGS